MSNYLINLARRGAGLPAGQITARQPVRESQTSSENFEQDQSVQTSEATAFETGSEPALETTPAGRAQTSQVSQAQTSEAAQVLQAPQAVLIPPPTTTIPNSIQRSIEPNNQTSNRISLTQSESSAPSVIDENYASEASTNSPKVARQLQSPSNEGPSSSATARPLTEKVVVATPRARTHGQLGVIDAQDSHEPAQTPLSEANRTLQIVPQRETPEYAPEGERKPELDQLRVVTLTPRLPVVEDQQLTKLSNVAPVASAELASMPIHVRIGKIEVHSPPPTVPPSAQRVGPAPIGFGSYHRLRTYRS